MNGTEKAFSELYKWLESQPQAESEQEQQAQIDQFMQHHNSNLVDTIAPYDLLEQAETAETKTEKKKLAKAALELDSDFTDAKLFLIELEANSFDEAEPKLLKLLEEEKQFLEREGLYGKENIGHFYMIFETRPYMRIYQTLLFGYHDKKDYAKERAIAEEMLRLNTNDNQGIRYLALGLYAHFGDGAATQRLVREYPDDCGVFWLVPQLIQAFKQNDRKEGQKIIRQLRYSNKHALDLLRGKRKLSKHDQILAQMAGYYYDGSYEEAVIAISDNLYAIPSMLAFTKWVDQIAGTRANLK